MADRPSPDAVAREVARREHGDRIADAYDWRMVENGWLVGRSDGRPVFFQHRSAFARESRRVASGGARPA